MGFHARKPEVHRWYFAADQLGQRLARTRAMGPAQGAVAGVDPEFVDLGAADQRNVGRGRRAQAGPELRVTAFFGCAGVGHAREHFLNAGAEEGAAGE